MTKKELLARQPKGNPLVARGKVFFNGIKNGTPLMKMFEHGTNQICTIYHVFNKIRVGHYIELNGIISDHWDEENKKDCHLIFDKYQTYITILEKEEVENPEYSEI